MKKTKNKKTRAAQKKWTKTFAVKDHSILHKHENVR